MSRIDELLEIQKDCIHEANRLEKIGLDMISRDLQSVSERIGDVLQLVWLGDKEK